MRDLAGQRTVAPFSRRGLWPDSCCHTPIRLPSYPSVSQEIINPINLASSRCNRSTAPRLRIPGPLLGHLDRMACGTLTQHTAPQHPYAAPSWQPTRFQVMTLSPAVDARDDYARLKVLLANGVMPSLGHDRQCT